MATLTNEQIEQKKLRLKQLAEEAEQLKNELVEAGAIELSEDDLDKVAGSYIKNAVSEAGVSSVTEEDIEFLIAETRHDRGFVEESLGELGVKLP